ncbi:MAG: peptidase MA family metallohydrolase [Candidatus Hodarchaeales archaeon]|jgi:hypothetical protein
MKNSSKIFPSILLLIIGFGLTTLSASYFLEIGHNSKETIQLHVDSIPVLRTSSQKAQLEENGRIKRHISDYEEILTSNYQIQQLSEVQGETRIFLTPNLETMEYYEVNATLEVVGSHCLIYSNLTTANHSQLLQLNHTFETTIFPVLTMYFGLPPDIDNNSKVIILVYDILDGLGGEEYVAGFFQPLNQYFNSDLNPSQRYSNEAEILFIDQLAMEDYGTVTHEFQHLIHYEVDSDEETWFDEGLSMYSEFLAGYDPFTSGGYQTYFEMNPNVSLTYWDYYNSQNFRLANYGASYAFYRYIAEKYGNVSLIQQLFNESENGITSIENVLTRMGYNFSFQEIFRNWTIANFLNNNSLGESMYGYENLTLEMNIEESYNSLLIPRTENNASLWGTDYLQYNWSIDTPFYLEFQGSNSSNFLLTVILTNKTTFPRTTLVFPIDISETGLGVFSTDAIGVIGDTIELVISAYPASETPDYNDTEAAPLSSYWFIVNPNKILISSGDLLQQYYGEYFRIQNVTASDSTGFIWQTAEGTIFEILTDTGEPTEITGSLRFNITMNFWESDWIDLSNFPAGFYRIKYYLFNSTSSGTGYSDMFSLVEITISSGLIDFSNEVKTLYIWNVLIHDNNGFNWNEADGAIYEIMKESGESTGIYGSMTYNITANYWESAQINLSSLSIGGYFVQYWFYNESVQKYHASQIFTITEVPVSNTTTTTTHTPPISNDTTAFTTTSLSIVSSSLNKITTSLTELTSLPRLISVIGLTLFVIFYKKRK